MNDVQIVTHCLTKFREMGLAEDAAIAMLSALHDHVETNQGALGDYHKKTITDIVDAAHKAFQANAREDGSVQ